MATRKIVEIDEERCNGCGQCVPNCAEGALQIVNGKAKLVKDEYCDGLGACLGTCPQDAIRIIEREAEEFDEEAVEEHLAAREDSSEQKQPAGPAAGGVCPGAALMNFQRSAESAPQQPDPEGRPSALTQWPVQLMLVPAGAPFLDGADLLLAADCTPFALADFHERFLTGRKLLVGCPKLDDAPYYAEKLADILRQGDVKSITIVRMEVPCCSGLTAVARRAIEKTNSDVPLREVVVGVQGQVIEDREHAGASTQG
jgi:Fe-S-cluster-containing hydrogenase component 2